jgi:hypothetical protein
MPATATISKLSLHCPSNVATIEQAYKKESDATLGLSLGIIIALAEITLGAVLFLLMAK